MTVQDILTLIASHHSAMLGIGSAFAVLPFVLTSLNMPASRKEEEIKRAEEAGQPIPKSYPKTHSLLQYGGFLVGLLSAYSAYLTAVTGNQNPEVAGVLGFNALLLISRTAKEFKWAFPAGAAGGAAIWWKFLQVLNASPELYVSVLGWVVVSLPCFVVAIYAERAVKFTGEVLTLGPLPALLGSIGGIESVFLLNGMTIGSVVFTFLGPILGVPMG